MLVDAGIFYPITIYQRTMLLTATACDSTSEITYKLSLNPEVVSSENGELIATFNETDFLDLYFQLKEFKCGLADPSPA